MTSLSGSGTENSDSNNIINEMNNNSIINDELITEQEQNRSESQNDDLKNIINTNSNKYSADEIESNSEKSSSFGIVLDQQSNNKTNNCDSINEINSKKTNNQINNNYINNDSIKQIENFSEYKNKVSNNIYSNSTLSKFINNNNIDIDKVAESSNFSKNENNSIYTLRY